MNVPSAVIAAALLATSGALLVPTASAEDPKDKSITEQAREQGAARLRELQEAERTAREKLREAEQQVKGAEQQLKSAAADAKQAAQKALSDAKRALQAAQAKARAAKDKGADKAAELKADITEVAAQARDEAEGAVKQAEGAVEQAGAQVKHMRGLVGEIARDALGASGEHAARKQARRSAWRRMSGRVERPRDVPPAVREELRRHAQRVARLQRIRVVATEQNDRDSVARVDKLLARENARHEKRLPALWDAAGARKGGEDDEQEPAEQAAEDEEEQP